MISIFPLWTFNLYVTAFQQHVNMYLYISQLIRYLKTCDSYPDFADRRLLLTRKLLNQGFLMVMFEGFAVATMIMLFATEYLCHKWPRYVPLMAITIRFFPQSWLIIGFLTRVIRRMPLVVEELFHLIIEFRFPIFLWGSCCLLLSVCPLSFGHSIICPSSICSFLLPLCILKLFLHQFVVYF